jgi:hypothetical protein
MCAVRRREGLYPIIHIKTGTTQISFVFDLTDWDEYFFKPRFLFLKICPKTEQTKRNGTNKKKQTKPTRRNLLESQRARKRENPSGWLVEA